MTPFQTELDQAVRVVNDFPIEGVRFRDISPIFENPRLFDLALQAMVEGIDLDAVDAFVGIESRGFILGAALAVKFKKGFVPLRKAGKLPPPVLSESYALEYGQATLEIRGDESSAGHAGDHAGDQENRAARVVVIDDVLATGGTLTAAIRLCERAKLKVQDVRVLIDIAALNQFRFQGRALKSVLSY